MKHTSLTLCLLLIGMWAQAQSYVVIQVNTSAFILLQQVGGSGPLYAVHCVEPANLLPYPGLGYTVSGNGCFAPDDPAYQGLCGDIYCDISISVYPTPATCGQNNASVSFGLSNGNGSGYDINFNGQGWSSTSVFNNLAPGTYTVAARNSDGTCETSVSTFTLTDQSAGLMMTAMPTSCDPATNTYDLSVAITGNTMPSTGDLTVSFGSETQTISAPFANPITMNFTGVGANGPNNVAVNANFTAYPGCNINTTFVEPENCTPPCTISLTASPSTCNTSNNQYYISGQVSFTNPPTTGTIELTVSGGGSISIPFPQSSPINYTINGLNSDGMSKTVTATFSYAPACTASAIINAPVQCNTPCPPSTYSMCQGESYTLTAPANYTGIQWFTLSGATAMPIGGANTNILVVTQAGTYYYTATDNASCAIELCCPVTVTISNPLPSISIVTVPDCGLSNGALTATVTGGTSPYTYLWSTIPVQTLANATGLSAGNYTVTITDDTGCTNSASITLSNPSGPSVTCSSTSAACNQNNGSATATATGGVGPYTYLWSTTPAQTNDVATNLVSGIYTVTVTDQNNCSITCTTNVASVNNLTANCSHTSPTCGQNNGSVSVTPSGGSPGYSYIWSTTPAQVTSTASGLDIGTYTVTVTDVNMCTTTCQAILTNVVGPSCNIVLNTQPSCANANGGSATASATGGTGSYTFAWSNNVSGSFVSGISAGTYTVTVSDANNCSNTCQLVVAPPTGCCNINAIVPDNLSCFDNGTPNLLTDNRIRFNANVTNGNASLTSYHVSINGGTTITPNTNIAYGVTQFTLGPGTAGGGGIFTIIVTDSATPGCTQTFQITDPGNCTPSNPPCPTVNCGTATIQLNGN